MAVRGRTVSFKSIAREIRKKEAELKSLRRGATPKQVKVINLKISRLKRLQKSMRPFLLWP